MTKRSLSWRRCDRARNIQLLNLNLTSSHDNEKKQAHNYKLYYVWNEKDRCLAGSRCDPAINILHGRWIVFNLVYSLTPNIIQIWQSKRYVQSGYSMSLFLAHNENSQKTKFSIIDRPPCGLYNFLNLNLTPSHEHNKNKKNTADVGLY